jgi:hypothetical protein
VRHLVESDGNAAAAQAIGDEAFTNQIGHLDRVDTEISVEGQGVSDSTFVRCARVSVTYRYTTPAVTVPLIGGWGSGIVVTSTHSEIVDPYRAGLGEESLC